MKYIVSSIKRPSRNNGINFCQYLVVANAETKEIVYDGNDIARVKGNREKVQNVCDKLNNGELETELVTTTYGVREKIKM